MNVRVRELIGVKSQVAEVTPDALAQIKDIGGGNITADDIHIRPARVAHNQYDRTHERFQKAHLERFAETLPGKSLLPGHDTSQLPLGRWFSADTRTRTEEFPVVQLKRGEKAVDIVPGMAPERVRVTWLEAAFYFANDPSTDGMRKNIDTGVYQDVSIGFSYDDIACDVCGKSYLRSDCPHLAGRWIEDRLCTLTYTGDPKAYEARETSIVYLGAQQQAELSKQLREGNVDPKALARTPLGEDLVALKRYEALAREYGHAQKSWAFPALDLSSAVAEEKTPPVGGEADPPEADASNGEDMKLIEKARELFGLKDDATEEDAITALEQAKAKLDAAPVTDPLSAVGTSALADLKQSILDAELKLNGKESAELMEIVALHVEKANYARLKELAAEKAEAVAAKFPAEAIGRVQTDDVQEAPAGRACEFALL